MDGWQMKGKTDNCEMDFVLVCGWKRGFFISSKASFIEDHIGN